MMVGNSSRYNTTVQIIHDIKGWSNAIRTLFIYGTGVFRLHLIRSGDPRQRAFVKCSTLASAGKSKVLDNSINDPEYLKRHIDNWKQIWIDRNKGIARVEVDSDTDNMRGLLEEINKKIPDFTNY
jgi:hypothetical protein